MNGFLERKCADHLDDVLGLLETNYNIQAGPVQHNWKIQIRIEGKQRLPLPVETPERWEADKDERYGMDSNTRARS